MAKQKVIAPAVWANEYHEGDESGGGYHTAVLIPLNDFLKQVNARFKGVLRENLFVCGNDAGVVVLRQTKRERAKAKRDTAKQLANAPTLLTVRMPHAMDDALRGLAFRRGVDHAPLIQQLVTEELKAIGRKKLVLTPEESQMNTMLNESKKSSDFRDVKLRSVLLAHPTYDKLRVMSFEQKLSKGLIVNVLLQRALLRVGGELHPELRKIMSILSK